MAALTLCIILKNPPFVFDLTLIWHLTAAEDASLEYIPRYPLVSFGSGAVQFYTGKTQKGFFDSFNNFRVFWEGVLIV
jgi:hypothetical protein